MMLLSHFKLLRNLNILVLPLFSLMSFDTVINLWNECMYGV